MRDTGRFDTGRDFWDAAIVMSPAAQKLHSSLSVTSPYEGNRVDITLMVLCLNNEEGIIATLDTLVEAMDVVEKTFEILVIDDGSKDRSLELVRGYITEFPHLKIMLRINKKKKGMCLNYIDGAFIGCGKYYRMAHADNSEAVETMVDVLRSLGEADIIVPYYVSMKRKGLWERFRVNGYSWCINKITGNEINFYNALHVHLRYNVMRWRSVTLGTSFQSDLLCQLLDFGFTYKQVPCRAVPKRAPLSKRSRLKNLLAAVHTMLELVVRRISNHLHANGD